MPRYAWNKDRKVEWTQVMCFGCGEHFLKSNSEIAKSKGRHYCSRDCATSDPVIKVCKECRKVLSVESFEKQGTSKLTGAQYYRPRCKECNKPIKAHAQQKRISIKGNVVSDLTLDQWEKTLSLFDDSCAYCGKLLTEVCKDHFVPLTLGGAFTVSNILPVCRSCNSSKGSTHPQEWLPHAEFHQLGAVLQSML